MTINDVVQIVRNSLTSLGSPLAKFPNFGNAYVLIRSIGQAIESVFSQMRIYQENLYLSSASGEALDLKAADFGITRKPGFKSKGFILVSSQATTVIPAGTIFYSNVGNIQIETTYPVTTSQSEVAVPVISLVSSQSANLPPQTITPSLTFPNIVSEVGKYRDSEGNAALGLQGGADPESDQDLRSRVLSSLFTNHSGTYSSLMSAIRSIPSVDKVFIKEHSPVTGVFTVLLNNSDATLINEVTKVVREHKPLGVSFLVRSITEQPIDLILNISVNKSLDLSQLVDRVKEQAQYYIYNLNPEDTATSSSLLARITSIEGVNNASCTFNGFSSFTVDIDSMPIVRSIKVNVNT